MQYHIALISSIYAIYMIHSLMLGLGTGRYPSHDPWNKPFSKEYCKSRWMLSGQPIADGYVSILDGVQGDQDFIRILFNPSRPLTQMGPFMLIFLFDYNPKMEDIPILFAWVYSCKVSIRDNCAVTIVEPVNGSMLMRMTVYANSCTPTLGREHPIGTRAIAVLGSFLLKRTVGEKNTFLFGNCWHLFLVTGPTIKASHCARMAGCQRAQPSH